MSACLIFSLIGNSISLLRKILRTKQHVWTTQPHLEYDFLVHKMRYINWTLFKSNVSNYCINKFHFKQTSENLSINNHYLLEIKYVSKWPVLNGIFFLHVSFSMPSPVIYHILVNCCFLFSTLFGGVTVFNTNDFIDTNGYASVYQDWRGDMTICIYALSNN
jgi:hypothetical protein